MQIIYTFFNETGEHEPMIYMEESNYRSETTIQFNDEDTEAGPSSSKHEKKGKGGKHDKGGKKGKDSKKGKKGKSKGGDQSDKESHGGKSKKSEKSHGGKNLQKKLYFFVLKLCWYQNNIKYFKKDIKRV